MNKRKEGIYTMYNLAAKMKADYAETFFNTIKMGRYMQKKVQTLINCILTSEYQSKKQIFDQYASKFEGHTPNYILEELVYHGIVEKEIREEGTIRKPFEDCISFRYVSDFYIENKVIKYSKWGSPVVLERDTVEIGEPYNSDEYRKIKGIQLIPIRRAYYRLKGC